MSLSDLSSASLKRLVELVAEKEATQAKLEKIQSTIEELVNGSPAAGIRGGKAPAKKRGKRRGGKLKDRLLKALESAGKAGMTVKDLAVAVKAKPTSVSVWFYTTGKKIKSVKKVAPGRYAYIP
jgi:hypothetical protein